MGRKFEFRDNSLKLDIAGNVFELDTTDVEVVKRVQTFADDAQKIGKEIGARDDYAEAVAETIEFCLESIDSILGKGASEKIFASRKVSLFDCLDVINYVSSEINEDRAAKFQTYSPNRAQRRAK